MATLYLTEPGSQIHKEHGRLRVEKEGKTLLVVPLNRVSEVVVMGTVGLTTAAMQALLEAKIGLTMLSRSGQLRGRLTPPTGKNVPLRRAQYEQVAKVDFCLALGRACLTGKLRNSYKMARRMAHTNELRLPVELSQLKRAANRLVTCHDKAALMGVEGHAAETYFTVLRAALKGDLAFDQRSRRPPKDPVNALLSLGYSLLSANIMTALEIVGLDPYCGFLHAEVYGRPALALDLMEEFRAIIVDSVVLTLVNNRQLTQRDFETNSENEGIYLNQRGRQVFFAQYNRRLTTTVFHPLAGRSLSYYKIFEVQARQVAKLIQGEIDSYRPFVVR